MTVVRKLVGAAGAATFLAPFAVAPAADAGGRRCGGNPEVCFETVTTADLRNNPRGFVPGGSGLEIAQVNLYTTNTKVDVKVKAQIFMFKRGVYLHGFKTQSYTLPKATQQLLYVTPKKVEYCPSGFLGGTLPNSSFTTPCHRWEEGYRMGANFYKPNGETLVQLASDAQTLGVEK